MRTNSAKSAPVHQLPKSDGNCGSAFSLVALGALALLAGIWHKNSLAMAFGVPLLVGPLVAWLIMGWSLRRIEVERDIPPAAFEQDEIDITFKIHNRSPLPVFYPVVQDVFTPELHEPKRLAFPYRLIAGETVEDGYSGKCLLPRGLHAIGPGLFSISDPYGWMLFSRPLPRSAPMKIYPPVLRFGRRDRMGEAVPALRDENTLLGRGESLEFFSVREYQLGDPLRRVHWPLTAHLGTPVVREFLRNAAGNLTLFFDLYRPALVGIGRSSSLEHAVKILVAFAAHALNLGHRVQAFAHGKEAMWIPYGGGKAQLDRLLDLTVQLRPDGEVPLPELLSRSQHRLRRGDGVVLPVSPYLFSTEEFLEPLRRLRRQGFHPVALVFDDVSFRPLWHGQSDPVGKTDELLSRLESWGIESHRILCGADLAMLFTKGLFAKGSFAKGQINQGYLEK